ncbi:MAG TPA: carbohydrate ABC transporter permease [Thermoplasmata archaeon]|nr:carbohydrate ABC transporter permease [Thermoplasmata archaeon]
MRRPTAAQLVARLRRIRVRPSALLAHGVAWGIGLAWLIPFLGLAMAAIRPIGEILFGWWDFQSFHPTLANFAIAWDHDSYPMSEGLRNSFLVAIPSTLIPILVGAMVGYGFARFRFPLRDYIFVSVVVLMAIPQQMVAVPLFRTMLAAGLVDTFQGLILVHSAWGIPWILLFMRNFFQTLPAEVEEAARVDGAGDFKIFVKIVMPMALPAFAAIAVLQFMWVWNDFFFAQILMYSQDQLLATQRVTRLAGQFYSPWDLMSAASIIVLIVPVALYAFLQRYYIRGMIGWTIKG